MQPLLTIKQGDLGPPVEVSVVDETSAPVDLTGALATFSMRPSRAPTVATINDAAAMVNVGASRLTYFWLSGDTAEPGTYDAQFHVQPASGVGFQVPTDGYITVVVEPRIGA